MLSDASSTITAGEWFIGSDPGPGLATPLAPIDGSFDGTTETVTGAIEVTGRPLGELLVSVRARDAAGSWGQPAIAAALVTPADGIFADGFETGTTGRWSSVSGSSRIAVGASAAMAGRFGVTITAASGSSGFMADTTPAAAKGYHARFGLDARTLATGGKAIDVFTALTAKNANVIELQYRRDATGLPQIRLGVARAGAPAWSGWRVLSGGRHAVELGWEAASSATATLSIDGTVVDRLTGLDTRAFAIETVRLGPSAGLSKTVSGELHFDRFVSTRGSTVGA